MGTAAAEAGLKKGDIVLSVDGKEITNLTDFQDSYETINEAGKGLVLLDVKRGALTRFELLKLEPVAESAGIADQENETRIENGDHLNEEE